MATIEKCKRLPFNKFVDDRNVDRAVEDFSKDFEKIDPNKKTMIDYLN